MHVPSTCAPWVPRLSSSSPPLSGFSAHLPYWASKWLSPCFSDHSCGLDLGQDDKSSPEVRVSKTCRCSGPLYKTAQYLHGTSAHPPVGSKPPLGDLQCPQERKCCVHGCYPALLREYGKGSLGVFSRYAIFFLITFDPVGWIHECKEPLCAVLSQTLSQTRYKPFPQRDEDKGQGADVKNQPGHRKKGRMDRNNTKRPHRASRTFQEHSCGAVPKHREAARMRQGGSPKTNHRPAGSSDGIHGGLVLGFSVDIKICSCSCPFYKMCVASA